MNPKPDYDRLYEIAEEQAGYFTTNQAKRHGFSWERLSETVERGRFLCIFRGINRLAHFPSLPHEDLFVAWLRTKLNSIISHESALTILKWPMLLNRWRTILRHQGSIAIISR